MKGKGIRKLVLFGLVMALITSLMGCAPSTVEAAAPADTKANGLTEEEYWKLFPPNYDLIGMVDWNVAWNNLRGPGTPGRAPSEAEILQMYSEWAKTNGFVFFDENAKKSVAEVGKNGGSITLVPAVYSTTGALAIVGTMKLSATSTGFSLGGAALTSSVATAGAALVGAVVIAGVVYLGYKGYVYLKTHTHKTHAPDSLAGKSRINTLRANKGKGPDEKCFKMTMDYLVKDQATGKMVQAVRYGIAQKIVGANYGNSWLWGVFEPDKWVTVYPVTGDVTQTSSKTKFVELIACYLLPPMPPTP